MSKNPIGIFDSGIGGLTIAHAIKNKLPNESLIYFGDTKHLPYGEKSEKAIKDYSLKIAEYLKKIIVKPLLLRVTQPLLQHIITLKKILILFQYIM